MEQQQYTDIRVLVTGGAGFIGSHLAERLTMDGANVTILDDLSCGTLDNLTRLNQSARFVKCSITDIGTVRRVLEESKPNYIFHLAASASVADSVQNPSNDFNRNNFGTARLLEAVRLWGGDCRIVLASSGAVYGEPSNLPIRETDPLNPISPYGANKASTEMNARAYAHSYGLDIVTARLFNTYGPRMVRFVLLDFIRKLQKNADRLEVLGTGQQVRDFSYVDDVCEGLLLLGDAGESGEAYHVASGHSVTVQELAERLIKQLGLHSRLVFTGTSWAGDAQQWVVDIEKIRGLGYAPQVDLDEGIAQTVAWFEKGFGPINRK